MSENVMTRLRYVIDELTGPGLDGVHFAGAELSKEERDAAVLGWRAILGHLKKGQENADFTSAEVDRAMQIFFALQKSVISARGRSIRGFRVVDGGKSE